MCSNSSWGYKCTKIVDEYGNHKGDHIAEGHKKFPICHRWYNKNVPISSHIAELNDLTDQFHRDRELAIFEKSLLFKIFKFFSST